MIKLPEEITDIIRTIEDAGFSAYAVGGCVRDSILGKPPEDWDITSNASRETLEALFPNAQVINKKLGVMRVSSEEFMADVATFRIDGEYKDYRRPDTVIFTEDINEDLRRRDFTMNAIAFSPARGVVDPYHGMEDIKRKLVRGIGEPTVRFEEDALRILRAARFAAQLGFEIDKETLLAMKGKAPLLEHISTERIREEFTKTAISAGAGKGIAILLEAGLLPYIFGTYCRENTIGPAVKGRSTAAPVTEQELSELKNLAGSIHLSEPDPDIRIALVYQCLEEDKALHAINFLGYSNALKKKLRTAVSLAPRFGSITDKAELKRIIYEIGLEQFLFLTRLSKQPHIESMWEEIRKSKEPVFPEDLAVNGEDFIELGILEGIEIGRRLRMLLSYVHQYPEDNYKSFLLKLAQKGI